VPVKPKAVALDPSRRMTANPRQAFGMREFGNPERMQFAIDCYVKDCRGGGSEIMRSARVRHAVRERFHCSISCAERTWISVRNFLAAQFMRELPAIKVGLIERFTRIAASAEEEHDYGGAVAALREYGRLVGAYAPQQVEISAGVTAAPQLRELVAVLDDRDRADLERILANVEAAKVAGRLTDEAVGNVIDVEADDAIDAPDDVPGGN